MCSVKYVGPIFTFTNIYIIKRMPLFILAVFPGNWIVHCTFLSSLVYTRLIFVQFSLFLYSSVCKSVWKSHPYENSLIPTLVWILYAREQTHVLEYHLRWLYMSWSDAKRSSRKIFFLFYFLSRIIHNQVPR